MQLFERVTIFAFVLLLGAIPPGCGSGRGHLGKTDAGRPVGVDGAQQIEARVERAVQHYREGDLEAAEVILGEILAADPTNPRALEYRRYLYKIVYCTVYPGDTLSEIARYYYEDGTLWPVLVRANGLSDPRRVQAYARLRVPWFPVLETGKDELGRLQGGPFRDRKTEKILLHPLGKNDTLESLAREYYGSARYGLFLADYNQMESRTGTPGPGTLVRIPVLAGEADTSRRSPAAATRQGPEAACLETARNAIRKLEFQKGCDCLTGIPDTSPERAESEDLLSRCRTEGVSHYERLGDASLRDSDPESAFRHWQSALSLDPENAGLKRKLQETRDLMKTLEMLPEIR